MIRLGKVRERRGSIGCVEFSAKLQVPGNVYEKNTSLFIHEKNISL
jgi:hypothetical protein